MDTKVIDAKVIDAKVIDAKVNKLFSRYTNDKQAN